MRRVSVARAGEITHADETLAGGMILDTCTYNPSSRTETHVDNLNSDLRVEKWCVLVVEDRRHPVRSVLVKERDEVLVHRECEVSRG